MCRKMLKSLLLLLVLGVLGLVNARSNGPPSQSVVCEDISPDPSFHGPTQGGNGGYVIATNLPLSATAGFYNYEGGVTYSVQIQSSSGTEFLGFLVQARDADGDGVGTFTTLQSDQRIQDCTAFGFAQGTTISHSAPTFDEIEEFSWQAPAGSGGLVDFRYAVVVTRFDYYSDQSAAANAALVMDAMTTPPNPPPTPTLPPTPPPGLVAPVRELEDYRITARFPDSCVPSECDLFVGIDTNVGDTEFLDVYMEGNADGWIAVGFTSTPNMFDADVLGCNRPTTDVVEIVDTWNSGTPLRNNVRDDIQDSFSFSTSLENGRIACSFARSIAGSNVGTEDLSLDQPYFVLFGVSPNSQEGSLSFHSFGAGNPMISAVTVNASQDTIDINNGAANPMVSTTSEDIRTTTNPTEMITTSEDITASPTVSTEMITDTAANPAVTAVRVVHVHNILTISWRGRD